MRKYGKGNSGRHLVADKASISKSYKTQTSPRIVNNDQLELTPGGALILSDEENHKNVVNVLATRTEWKSDDISKNMDMKIFQLVTPEGYVSPEQEVIDEIEEEQKPPLEKPKFLSLQARNMKYIVADGRAFENIAAQDRAFMPAGDSLTGGDSSAIKPIYLFYRKSHPIFYIREMLNYIDEDGENVTEGLEYKWTLDGDVVSDQPYFQMFRAESDDQKQWRESKDRTITCEISNSQGSISQDITFRVYGRQSGEDGDNSHRALKGFYWEFDQERFDKQSRSPVRKVEDPRFANRQISIKKININLKDPRYANQFPSTGNSYNTLMRSASPPGWLKRKSKYRIDGGAWRGANGHFMNSAGGHNNTTGKRERPFNWERMEQLGKEIKMAKRGGDVVTIDFEMTFRNYYYYRNIFGSRRTHWYSVKVTGSKTINVTQDPNITHQEFELDVVAEYINLNR